MITRWFGGLVAPGGKAVAVPEGCQLLDTHLPAMVWTCGEWLGSEVRTARTGARQVTVFGSCSATDDQLERLAVGGVDADVLTAFAGSYTVVESTREGVVVFTDLGHTQPIYTADTASGVLWGSSALAVAALIGAAPDPTWLAAALLAPDDPAARTGRSAFTGVATIPPGCRLVLTPGAAPLTHQAWRPEHADIDLVEGARRVRAALTEAVRVRVAASRRLTADCSGGMDSTSLTLLAANQLTSDQTMSAVTIHPAGTTRGGDLDYASAAVTDQPQVRHLLCPLEYRHLPYSRLLELTPATDEPAPATIAIARAVAEFDLLREHGSDCHLTGDGGDTVLGGHPAYLADLARAARVGRLGRHAIAWARLRRTPVWPLLAQAATDAVPGRSRPESPIGTWATPAARELYASVDRDGADPPWPDAGTRVAVEAIQAVGRTARADIQIAAKYGIAVHNPFADPQVIAACLKVPGWQRCSPFEYKPLLATAMAGLLPERIATRRTKGDFTPDHYLGLRANLTQLRELAAGRLAELGLINPVTLRRSLDRAAAGLPVAFSEFEPVLTAEVWLRAVEAAAPALRWAEAATVQRTSP